MAEVYLDPELKRGIWERIRKDVPRFAEQIITERQTVRDWAIRRWVYNGEKFVWAFVEFFRGDQEDAVTRCFELKKAFKWDQQNCFGAVPSLEYLTGSDL